MLKLTKRLLSPNAVWLRVAQGKQANFTPEKVPQIIKNPAEIEPIYTTRGNWVGYCKVHCQNEEEARSYAETAQKGLITYHDQQTNQDFKVFIYKVDLLNKLTLMTLPPKFDLETERYLGKKLKTSQKLEMLENSKVLKSFNLNSVKALGQTGEFFSLTFDSYRDADDLFQRRVVERENLEIHPDFPSFLLQYPDKVRQTSITSRQSKQRAPRKNYARFRDESLWQ